jgi:putative protease
MFRVSVTWKEPLSMQFPRPNKPEVMSPAGYWPQLHAAIEAGADSVYFGLKHFTARAKVGFVLSELPEVMRTLHRRGVRGFVTFNTLVFDHELREAVRALAAIVEAGADAVIVQDAGIVRLTREIAPTLEIHASTQMSITNAEGVEVAQRLGVNRVTLARELSLDEVRAIWQRTSCELEIFVHGALCVAYSGQCFSSEAWGGRSANRGQCAQACRLPYEMIVDGEWRPLGDARYLLSPGDLFALHQIPEICRIGIAALKIEGRYKDADYVALATRAYRKAVDEAWAGTAPTLTPAEELQLEQVYSRGLGPYFITGTNHQAVVDGRAPRHRGVLMGRVSRVVGAGVVIEPAEAHAVAPLKPGDGVVFDAADWRSPEEPEEGGRVYQVTPAAGRSMDVRFGRGVIDTSRIRPGDRLWRTHDPDLDKLVRPLIEASAPVRKQTVWVRFVVREGQPLEAEWRLAADPSVSMTVRSTVPLGTADRHRLTEAVLKEQFSRLGNTPYELGRVEVEIHGRPFAPVSLLNQLRREAVEKLSALQSQPRSIPVANPEVVLESALSRIEPVEPGDRVHQIHVLVRTPEQLDAAIEVAPSSITLDYLDLYGLKPSVERVRSAGIAVRIASPRVLKPGEERVLQFLMSLDCPILVRSAGLLRALEGLPHPPLTGDCSLNAANAITADLFLRSGLERIAPTYDLNAEQVATLARETGAARIEAVVYQHLPVFHTEHCVFCRFLSNGTTYKDCGRPCEQHRVALRDAAGRSHPVMADVGCRNTVFGSEAQEASAHIDDWRRAGILHYRLEFVHESREQTRRVVRALDEYLAGRLTSRQLGEEWRRDAPQGVTEGSFLVPSNYLTLPVLQ